MKSAGEFKSKYTYDDTLKSSVEYDQPGYFGVEIEDFGTVFGVARKNSRRVWTAMHTAVGIVLMADFHTDNVYAYVVTKEEWGDPKEKYLLIKQETL